MTLKQMEEFQQKQKEMSTRLDARFIASMKKAREAGLRDSQAAAAIVEVYNAIDELLDSLKGYPNGIIVIAVEEWKAKADDVLEAAREQWEREQAVGALRD